MHDERLPSHSIVLPETLQLSVVVPTHGRPEPLEQLLLALGRQTLSHAAFEVIVVDDGGRPAASIDLEGLPFRCRLTQQAHGGPASARNVGLALAAAPIVLLLTDDAVPAPDLLERHVAAHRDLGEASAVLGSFRFSERARRSPFTRLLDESDLFQPFSALTDGERYGWPFVWTSNLSAPTEALLAAGGFDEGRFDGTVCDGLDLGLRLEEQGVGVLHRADCVAHHDHVITPEGFFERAFQLGRYQYRLGEKAGAPDVFFEAGTVTGDGLRPDIVDVLEQARAGSEATLERLRALEASGDPQGADPSGAAALAEEVAEAIRYPKLCGLYHERTGIDVRELSRDGAPAGTSVSVIAVSCNALANTQRCVESLRRAADPRFPQEILVVDNGSTDGSVEWLAAQSDVRLIRNPFNFGAPRARNQAIREATGDWVAFLDNDVFVPEGWLDRALYHGAVDPAVGAIPLCANRASKHQVVEYHGSDRREEVQRFAEEHFASEPRRGMDAVLFTSLGVLVRSEVLERIGGFDEAFSPWGFEDDDIALRVRLSGWRNRVARDTFVYHAFYDGPAKVERHNGWMEQNWRAFLAKWCPAAAGAPLFDYSQVQVPQLGEATEQQLRFDLPAPDAAPPSWPGAEHSAGVSPAAGSSAAGSSTAESSTAESSAAGSSAAGSSETESLAVSSPGDAAAQEAGAPARTHGRSQVVVLGATDAAIEAARSLLVERASAPDGAPSDVPSGDGGGVPEIVAINEFLLASSVGGEAVCGRLQHRFAAVHGPLEIDVDHLLRARMDRLGSGAELGPDPRLCYTLGAWRASLAGARYVCVFDDPARAADEMLRDLVRVPEYGGVSLDFDGAAELWRRMYRRVLDDHAAVGEWLFIHAEELETDAGRARLEAFTGRPLAGAAPGGPPEPTHPSTPVQVAVAETYVELCELAGYPSGVTLPEGPPRLAVQGPEISVVLTSWSGPESLERCLGSLVEQTAAGRFEVLVVDAEGGPAPGPNPSPWLHLRRVDAPAGGEAAARNAGVRAARAGLVLLLSGDVVAAPDLVERHLAAHAEAGPDRAVVGSTVPCGRGRGAGLVRAAGSAGAVHLPGQLDATRLHDWTAFRGSNLSLSREATLSVGGFVEDERLAAAMDLDLGFRLREERGVRVVHCAEAVLEHAGHFTFAELRQWTRDRAAGELRLLAAHPEAGRHREWRRRLEHSVARHDQLVVQTLPDRARAEAFMDELSRIDLGALEQTGAEGAELAATIEAQLGEYLSELTHLWRAEGELTALQDLGVEAVAELLEVDGSEAVA